jgi:hypothetical protein
VAAGSSLKVINNFLDGKPSGMAQMLWAAALLAEAHPKKFVDGQQAGTAVARGPWSNADQQSQKSFINVQPVVAGSRHLMGISVHISFLDGQLSRTAQLPYSEGLRETIFRLLKHFTNQKTKLLLQIWVFKLGST